MVFKIFLLYVHVQTVSRSHSECVAKNRSSCKNKAAVFQSTTGELVQTCASVPLQNFEYLLLKKYDEKNYGILVLDFKGM